MLEVAIFMTLITPMPFSWRRKLFIFLSENPIIGKIQYSLKITFIFILVLFVDSVNRVYRVHIEMSAAAPKGHGTTAETIGGAVRSEINSRRFYSERNMYLCGFTLFLSLILNRTYVMILETLRLEEEVKRLKQGKGGNDPAMQKELEKARKDLAAMKKQTEGLQKEYNRLGDEKSPIDGAVKKDR